MKKYKYKGTITYDGQRYWVYANTKSELAVKKAMKLRDLKEGKSSVTSNMLLRDWIDYCLATYKTNQNETTRNRYNNRVEHNITEHIGHIPISKVKPLHCQNVMNRVSGMSKKHVSEIYQALRFIFKYAKLNGLINMDPTENLTKPQMKAPVTRRALTPLERETVLKIAKTDRRFYIYLLMLLCGCRPAEAAECKGMDIQTIEGYHMLHIRGQKTVNADRFVPIDAELYAVIKDTPKDEYISKKETNRARTWRAFKRQMNIALGCKVYRNKLVPPYPVAPDLVPYCLRHEYCTDLARKGIDIRHAQKLMGHSDISLTANIYTNLAHNDMVEIARIMGAKS